MCLRLAGQERGPDGRIGFDHEDRAAPAARIALQGHQSDRARTNDEGGIAQAKVTRAHSVKRNSRRFHHAAWTSVTVWNTRLPRASTTLVTCEPA
jgi:hypothetical protein